METADIYSEAKIDTLCFIFFLFFLKIIFLCIYFHFFVHVIHFTQFLLDSVFPLPILFHSLFFIVGSTTT